MESETGRLTEAEARRAVARGLERGNEETLSKGRKVSVLQDGSVSES
jgi:hypothetical protein